MRHWSCVKGWQKPSETALPPSVPLHATDRDGKPEMEPPFVLHRIRLDPNLIRSFHIVHIDQMFLVSA